MAATRSKKRDTEKLPENETISKANKNIEKRKDKNENIRKPDSENWRQREAPKDVGEEKEIPFAKVRPLPEVVRGKQKSAEGENELKEI